MPTFTTRILAAVLPVAALLLTTACEIPKGAGTGTTAPAPVTAALTELPVVPEDTGAHYDRDDWPHWSTVSGACDTRETVLATQGKHVTTGPGCKVTGGEWTSRYDGVVVRDAKGIDIDHMVPLAEVARSGHLDNGRRVRPGDWPRKQRETYANDPAVLVAVTATSNRAKGDKDPAKWLPKLDRCTYVTDWITVKKRYGLSVDQAERNAIAAVLTHCP